jgi:dTDP-4-dehydrorhamnose reductase
VSARTLLLLGASGFLGPHLVRAARRDGWRVVAASRRPEAAPQGDEWRPDEAQRFDGFERGALEPLLERVRPSGILLAAALARVDECERDPARAEALNAELPAAVARATRARGLRFVHLSPDLVFGAEPPRGERYAEDDAPSPVHVYGRTKAAGEALVRSADPQALVVRLPLLYGASFGRGLGASDQLLAALARGERPTLFHDEWRTPLEAGNAAEAVVELLRSDERGLMHVAGPARLERHELGLAVLSAYGVPPAEASARVRAAPRSALGLEHLRPRDVSLDARRARALLATPLLAPDEALRDG